MDRPDQGLVRAFEEVASLSLNLGGVRRYLEKSPNDVPDPRESAYGRMELRHTTSFAAYAGSFELAFYTIDKWGVCVNLCPADEY